jgi:AmmeMemoRadiSam system protein B
MCFCGSKVICSDYEKCSHCRFSYTYYDKKRGPIYKSIEALDQKGIDIIESGDPNAFHDYLHDYGNTICGRHPIGVFLNMLKDCMTRMRIKFVQYEQSSHCKSMRDSSVSYASAVVTVEEE